MQSLGCIHFYPNLQGNPTGRQAPIPVVCGFPPCLSLPSGPLPHRNRAAPKGPMKNGSSKDSITKNPWQFKREWEAPHHEPTEAFDVFQNVFFFLQERHGKYLQIFSLVGARHSEVTT